MVAVMSHVMKSGGLSSSILLFRAGVHLSHAALFPRSALLHEMCACSMFSKCGSSDGGVPQLKPIL